MTKRIQRDRRVDVVLRSSGCLPCPCPRAYTSTSDVINDGTREALVSFCVWEREVVPTNPLGLLRTREWQK